MGELVQCDLAKCGKTSDRRGAVSWVSVEDMGIPAVTYGEKAKPWLFCSHGCLITYLLGLYPAQGEPVQGEPVEVTS